MAYLHQVVVHDVREVVCGKSIALQQNRIGRNILVFPCDVAEQMVVEFCLAFQRHFEADNVGLAGGKICLDFLFGQVAAVAVVAGSHLVFGLNFTDTLQTLGIAETIVCLAFCNEFFCILFVQFKTLALHIGTVFAAFIAALIPVNAEPCHRVVQILHVFFIVAGAVGIFQAQDEFAAL